MRSKEQANYKNMFSSSEKEFQVMIGDQSSSANNGGGGEEDIFSDESLSEDEDGNQYSRSSRRS